MSEAAHQDFFLNISKIISTINNYDRQNPILARCITEVCFNEFDCLWSTYFKEFKKSEGEYRENVQAMLTFIMIGTMTALRKEFYFSSREPKRIDLNTKALFALIKKSNICENEKDIDLSNFKKTQTPTVVFLEKGDVVDIAEGFHKSKGKDLAIMNFVSRKVPNGGWKQGLEGEEENITRRSNYIHYLYDRHQELYKEEGLPEYGGVYCKAVTFFRGSEEEGYPFLDTTFQLDIISVSEFDFTSRECQELIEFKLERKIVSGLKIALQNDIKILVFGDITSKYENSNIVSLVRVFSKLVRQYAGFFEQVIFTFKEEEGRPSDSYELFSNFFKHEQPLNPLQACRFKEYCLKFGEFDHESSYNHPEKCAEFPCQDKFSVSHSVKYWHPPKSLLPRFLTKMPTNKILKRCSKGISCDLINDADHRAGFSHPRNCLYFGECKSYYRDLKHREEYVHPPKCEYEGLCSEGFDNEHCKMFLHPPYCLQDNCLDYSRAHLMERRHPKKKCKYEHKCLVDPALHSDSMVIHYKHFSHVCLPVCSSEPDCSSDSDNEHMDKYSHMCTKGSDCRFLKENADKEERDAHMKLFIHARKLYCPHGDDCPKMNIKKHFRQFMHSNLSPEIINKAEDPKIIKAFNLIEDPVTYMNNQAQRIQAFQNSKVFQKAAQAQAESNLQKVAQAQAESNLQRVATVQLSQAIQNTQSLQANQGFNTQLQPQLTVHSQQNSQNPQNIQNAPKTPVVENVQNASSASGTRNAQGTQSRFQRQPAPETTQNEGPAPQRWQIEQTWPSEQGSTSWPNPQGVKKQIQISLTSHKTEKNQEGGHSVEVKKETSRPIFEFQLKPVHNHPTLEARNPPTLEAKNRPTLEAQHKPALEAQQKPALEAQQKPALEAQQKPTLEAQQKHSLEAQQKPTLEAQQKPTLEPQQKQILEPQQKQILEPQQKPTQQVQRAAGPPQQSFEKMPVELPSSVDKCLFIASDLNRQIDFERNTKKMELDLDSFLKKNQIYVEGDIKSFVREMCPMVRSTLDGLKAAIHSGTFTKEMKKNQPLRFSNQSVEKVHVDSILRGLSFKNPDNLDQIDEWLLRKALGNDSKDSGAAQQIQKDKKSKGTIFSSIFNKVKSAVSISLPWKNSQKIVNAGQYQILKSEHIDATLGRNLNESDGSIISLMKKNVMYHPDFYVCPISKSSIISGSFQREMPWVKITSESDYDEYKFHPSVKNWETVLGKFIVAKVYNWLKLEKKILRDKINLNDIKMYEMENKENYLIEAFLPAVTPLSMIKKIAINLRDLKSLSKQDLKSLIDVLRDLKKNKILIYREEGDPLGHLISVLQDQSMEIENMSPGIMFSMEKMFGRNVIVPLKGSIISNRFNLEFDARGSDVHVFFSESRDFKFGVDQANLQIVLNHKNSFNNGSLLGYSYISLFHDSLHDCPTPAIYQEHSSESMSSKGYIHYQIKVSYSNPSEINILTGELSELLETQPAMSLSLHNRGVDLRKMPFVFFSCWEDRVDIKGLVLRRYE